MTPGDVGALRVLVILLVSLAVLVGAFALALRVIWSEAAAETDPYRWEVDE